jgi:hypothetical protein
LSVGQYNVLEYKKNKWVSNIPFTMQFNTVTGAYENASGVDSVLDTVNSTLSNYVAVDECDDNPQSCGIFDPVGSFDGTEVFGDNVFDFVDDPSLNFGPDPFDTYQDTLTAGQTQEEFFGGSSLDDFNGMVADTFDGSTPDLFNGGSSLDDFGGGPELDMMEQEFDEVVVPEIEETYEEFTPEIEKQIVDVKKEENYTQPEVMSNSDDNLLIREDMIEVAVVKAAPVNSRSGS